MSSLSTNWAEHAALIIISSGDGVAALTLSSQRPRRHCKVLNSYSQHRLQRCRHEEAEEPAGGGVDKPQNPVLSCVFPPHSNENSRQGSSQQSPYPGNLLACFCWIRKSWWWGIPAPHTDLRGTGVCLRQLHPLSQHPVEMWENCLFLFHPERTPQEPSSESRHPRDKKMTGRVMFTHRTNGGFSLGSRSQVEWWVEHKLAQGTELTQINNLKIKMYIIPLLPTWFGH